MTVSARVRRLLCHIVSSRSLYFTVISGVVGCVWGIAGRRLPTYQARTRPPGTHNFAKIHVKAGKLFDGIIVFKHFDVNL